MYQTFAPILDLLDEGLRLYRRGFASFMLLTALAALPVTVIVVGFFLAAEQLSGALAVLIILGALFLGLPLSLFVMGALSRAATMVAAGEPIQLRRALAIGPVRMIGMGCYGTFFIIIASIFVSTITSVCFCVFYMFAGAGVLSFAAIGSAGGAVAEAVTGVLVTVVVVAFIGIYAVGLVVNGAVYGSAVYALQPFVQDDLQLGAAAQRSLDLVTFRLGGNVLVFVSASLVFGAIALAATLAIGMLLPLPVLFLLGPESPIARAVTAAAWVVGVATAAPLLPIWMALLYRQRRVARQGEAIERAIALRDGRAG